MSMGGICTTPFAVEYGAWCRYLCAYSVGEG